jgi:diketogulonate reductase-like aldo/keto reductase
MPYLGLGVYGARRGRETQAAVRCALDVGYRLIDTAKLYGNEADVGTAVRESGVPRDEVFVTTKLWNDDHGYDAALRAFDHSLRELGLGYVDLYLIHWPIAGLRRETWKALESLCAQEKARAIGVSNYTIRHLQELLPEAKVVPAVNQVEFSPFLYQEDLLSFCRDNSIQLEAYSPLTKGRRLRDPRLVAMALECRKTPAQVLLRWCLEKQVVTIPKSVRPERILENSQIFDFSLAAQDVQTLDSMQDGGRTSWDPTDAP